MQNAASSVKVVVVSRVVYVSEEKVLTALLVSVMKVVSREVAVMMSVLVALTTPPVGLDTVAVTTAVVVDVYEV